MSPLGAFQGCRDRVRRAESHNEAFAATWNAFIESEPYHAFIRVNNDGSGELHAECSYDLPKALSFELGELLYQLRAALDGCVYAAAVLETGKNPPPNEHQLEFPVCYSQEEFRRARWHLKPVLGNQRLMSLVESIQPYNVPAIDAHLMILNGNRTIGILHDWARKDRHRQLHLVGSWRSNMNPVILLPEGCALDYLMVTSDGLLESGTLVARFRLSGYVPGMNVQGNPDMAIDVAVREAPEPCADNDTLDMRVRSMIAWTRMVIDSIENLFSDAKQ